MVNEELFPTPEILVQVGCEISSGASGCVSSAGERRSRAHGAGPVSAEACRGCPTRRSGVYSESESTLVAHREEPVSQAIPAPRKSNDCFLSLGIDGGKAIRILRKRSELGAHTGPQRWCSACTFYRSTARARSRQT